MTDNIQDALADANRKDAEVFCKGAFGPFVTDVSQYVDIVAELLQHATDRAALRAPNQPVEAVAYRYHWHGDVVWTLAFLPPSFYSGPDLTVQPLYASPPSPQETRRALIETRKVLVKHGYCGAGDHGPGDPEINRIDAALSTSPAPAEDVSQRGPDCACCEKQPHRDCQVPGCTMKDADWALPASSSDQVLGERLVCLRCGTVDAFGPVSPEKK